jgi:hypothetical protein
MAAIKNNDENFVAKPIYRRFGGVEQSEFERWLDERLCAAPLIIHEPRDIMLDEHGRVQRAYRFTEDALARLCLRLAPGLSAYVRNVSGLTVEATCGPEVSIRAAVRAINETIRLRFQSALAGLGIVINTQDQVVEGIVGRNYRLLSNREAYDWLKAQAQATGIPYRFHNAVIYGRSMSVRLRSESHLFALPTPSSRREPFYGGWYLRNSETADSYLTAAAGLVRGWSGGMSLIQIPRSGRIRHCRGQRFDAAMRELEAALPTQYGCVADLEPRIVELTHTPLGLGAADHAGTVRRMTSRLQTSVPMRISAAIASEVMTNALLYGSYKSQRLGASVEENIVNLRSNLATDTLDLLSARTAYDVYNALLNSSLTQCLKTEEILCQAAHALLLGSFSLTVR